jgi:hypothetical protein
MRRTRNRKHRGGIWPFSNAPATTNAPPTPAVTPAANAGQENPGFFASLFGKKNNVAPNVAPAPAAPNVAPAPAAPNVTPAAQGGKRKNRCGMMGGSHFVGAPIGYNQVQAMGGQPSEKIMQHATTAGGRRKRKHRTRRTHRSRRTHRNKSRRHRKN